MPFTWHYQGQSLLSSALPGAMMFSPRGKWGESLEEIVKDWQQHQAGDGEVGTADLQARCTHRFLSRLPVHGQGA